MIKKKILGQTPEKTHEDYISMILINMKADLEYQPHDIANSLGINSGYAQILMSTMTDKGMLRSRFVRTEESGKLKFFYKRMGE